MAAAAERMSRVDTAWLRMDNDVNQMMIVGVWLLQPGISLQALRERVAAKLLKYDRFRQKAVQDATGAQWVFDEAFDIDRHVVPVKLERRRGQSPSRRSRRPCRRACRARHCCRPPSRRRPSARTCPSGWRGWCASRSRG